MIISVPHGGLVDVPTIPYRLSGCPVQGTSPDDPKEERCDFEAPHHDRSCIGYNCPVTTVTDDFTIDLALTIANRLEQVTGRRPHVVQCNMIRTKVDVNRGVGEAAQGNMIATQVFNDYHNYINEAKKSFGRGLVLDLHGQVRYALIHMMFDTRVSTNHAAAILYDLLQYLLRRIIRLRVSKAYRWIDNTLSLLIAWILWHL